MVAGAGTALFLSSGKLMANPFNENVNIAVIGTGGRAHALVQALASCENVTLTHICDVDQTILQNFSGYTQKTLGYQAKLVSDFRQILENKEVDAIAIATPEHWHAPMAILGIEAGKHVYVEKPCSHNLHENDVLLATVKKHNKVCQMGNQQRSSHTSKQAVTDIKNGLIGDVYFAKAWYTNSRGPIGTGVKVAAPATLDWDLWQGPAPREPYRDNIHPYNWHWFRSWGTGEIHNNGTHEIDICRWALGVGYPTSVSSSGGRLHFPKDDWEFFDTQVANYEFEGGKTLTWEGRSCNNMKIYDRGRGSIIHGTKGTILLDRDGYTLYDLNGNILSYISEKNSGTSSSTADTSGFDTLTVSHMQNFLDGIRLNKTLHSPIHEAGVTTHLCHLGNMAQDLQATLQVDPATGKVLNHPKANDMWGRAYAPGWEVS
jgi:predicted dehydrogenase